MTIQNFLQRRNPIAIADVPSGSASTPDELYENCITVPYPSDPRNPQTAVITQAIKQWHALLVWYASQPGAVLLSRLYESEKNEDKAWDNRRNSLTICKNYKYAFCSNWFARIIMTML